MGEENCWEREVVITELTKGRELMCQLQKHFDPMKQDVCQYLSVEILSSYDKALSLLNGTALSVMSKGKQIINSAPSSSTAKLESPHLPVDSSTKSSDRPSNSRKRKMISRRTEYVHARSGEEVPPELFGSYAEASCAALVVASISSFGINHEFTAMLYPLLISSMGILICLITTLFATDFFEIKAVKEIEPALKNQLIISTALMTVGIAIVTWTCLPSSFTIFNFGAQKVVKNWELFLCVAVGLWAGLIIGFVTEYYTSNAYSPVQDVADSCSHIPLDLSRKAEKGIQMGPQLTVKESPPYPVNITAELGRISSTPVSIRQLK